MVEETKSRWIGTSASWSIGRRLVFAALFGIVIVLGLGTRQESVPAPEFIKTYGGDTLWALMVYLGIGVLAPRWSAFRRGVAAYLFSVAIECSQLYHAAWIDAIRATTLGGLVLGFGFLWSDLFCYAIGIGFGAIVEVALTQKRP